MGNTTEKLMIFDTENSKITQIAVETDKFFKEKKSLFSDMMDEYGYKQINPPNYDKDFAIKKSKSGEYSIDSFRLALKGFVTGQSYSDLAREYKRKIMKTDEISRTADGSLIGQLALSSLITSVVAAEESIYSELLRDSFGPEAEKRFLIRNLDFVKEERQSSIEILQEAQNSGIDVSDSLSSVLKTVINNDEEILLENLEKERIHSLVARYLSSLNRDYGNAKENGTDTLDTQTIREIKMLSKDIDSVKKNNQIDIINMDLQEITNRNQCQAIHFQNLFENVYQNNINNNESIYKNMYTYVHSKEKILSGTYSNDDISDYLIGQYKTYEQLYSGPDTSKEMEIMDTLNFKQNLSLAEEYVSSASAEELLDFSKTKGASFILFNENAIEKLEEREDLNISIIVQNLRRTNLFLTSDVIDKYDESIEKNKEYINNLDKEPITLDKHVDIDIEL